MNDSHGSPLPVHTLARSASTAIDAAGPRRNSMAHLIHRERLSARLTEGIATDHDIRGKVVVVSGPAGAGKTSLLADWVRTLARPYAWIDITGDENNSILLCQAVHHALVSTHDETIDLPPPWPSTIVSIYIERLCEAIATADREVLIVLDDVHHLHDGLAVAALDQLLTQAPSNLSIVLAARYDPPLTWHAVAVGSRLTRLGAVDLAFDFDETQSLVEQYDLHLGPESLELIEQITQGWGALIRLAAQYMVERDEHAQALYEFKHTPRPVSDFLVGEVLAALSDQSQIFLMSTAVVDSFRTELADALTGGSDAGAQIDGLFERNFPLIRRYDADQSTWYSYHPMLREYLRAEMNRVDRSTYLELQLRAASWYESHHLDLAAFDQVLDVSNGGTEDFLERRGLGIVLDGHGQELASRLERSPTDIAESTVAKLLHAAIALAGSEPAAAEVYLEFAEQAEIVDVSQGALLHALKLETARTIGDPAAQTLTVRLTQAPLTGHPDIDAYSRFQVASTLANEGYFVEAHIEFRRAIAAAQLRDRYLLILAAMGNLAITAGLADDLDAMCSYAASGLDYANDHDLIEAPEMVFSGTASILSAYLRAQEIPAPASPFLDQWDGTNPPNARHPTHSAQVQIAIELHHYGAADERRRIHAARLRDAAARAITDNSWKSLTHELLPWVVAVFLEVGEVDWARNLVTSMVARHGESGNTYLAEASIRIATGHLMEAGKALLAADSTNGLSLVHRIYRGVLKTDIELASGNDNRAMSALTAALAMAEPGPTIRPFLWHSASLGPAIDRHRGDFGDLEDFAQHVRGHLAKPRLAPILLTPSEQKVLNHLTSGDTTEAIAANLFLSVNTVKTHLRGIYRKFDVNTRRDAVRVGRRRGLV